MDDLNTQDMALRLVLALAAGLLLGFYTARCRADRVIHHSDRGYFFLITIGLQIVGRRVFAQRGPQDLIIVVLVAES